MDDPKTLPVEYEHNPFSHSLDTAYPGVVDGSNRRLCRAQEKRAGKTDLLERLTVDNGLKTLNIYSYVGEFRHLGFANELIVIRYWLKE